MDRPETRELLLKYDVEYWRLKGEMWNLSHVQCLKGKNLIGCDLHSCNMYQIVLSEADLRGANLRYAILTWADVRMAKVSGADVMHTDLTQTNLLRAIRPHRLTNIEYARLDSHIRESLLLAA